MEADRERIAHVGHEWEVEKLSDVEFILEPSCVGAAVLFQDASQRPPLGGVIVAGTCRGGSVWHLCPLEILRFLGSPPVGGERSHRSDGHTCQRQDHNQKLRQPD